MMTSPLSAPPLSTGVNGLPWIITRYCIYYRVITTHRVSFSAVDFLNTNSLFRSLCGAAGLFWAHTIDSSLPETPVTALASRRSVGGLGPLTWRRSRLERTRPGSAHRTHMAGHSHFLLTGGFCSQGRDEGAARGPGRGR